MPFFSLQESLNLYSPVIPRLRCFDFETLTDAFSLTMLQHKLWQFVDGLRGNRPLLLLAFCIRLTQEGRYDGIIKTMSSVTHSGLTGRRLAVMLVAMMVELMKVGQVVGDVARVAVGESVHLPASPHRPAASFFETRAHTAKVCARVGGAAGQAAPCLASQVSQVAEDLFVAAPRLAVACQRGRRLVELPGVLLGLH